MKTYYYIYRVGGDAPKIKHDTLEEAELESLRLAEKHPNASFEILQCLGTTRMTKPSTFWMDGVIPPHIWCEQKPHEFWAKNTTHSPYDLNP